MELEMEKDTQTQPEFVNIVQIPVSIAFGTIFKFYGGIFSEKLVDQFL